MKARSVVQAQHEEMAAIFEVLKRARKVARQMRAEAKVGTSEAALLAEAIDELDEVRERHRVALT